MSTHTLSLLVENRHGALSRIANLFSGRGYNISSLTVAETDDATVSRMTIVVTGDESILEQIVKQLNKLIDVIKVIDFIGQPIIERELLLVRIDTAKSNRRDIIDIVDLFKGRVVSVAQKSLTIELAGHSDALEDFISMIKPFGIREIVRSGAIAIAKAKH
ncbi:MAG: acetolactate synthase small subunit [Chitinispirillaceae bacterium]|jgi:acetolactate synthase-1/3 small subunit|nr:acetolactate synthase small subunit [Chitinispirillaceae bacterium]